jgi:CMP-N,N'-diacetyllegionaminic acid synthase
MAGKTQKRTRIGLIPARGGSKRLPGKNIMELAGKPMIAWTIGAALESRAFDAVVVSTDDPAIAQVAEHYGAEVPFLRPERLSADRTGSMEVVEHALACLASERGQRYEEVMLLQPTSPLRDAEDIRKAIALFEAKGADAVISVSEMEHSPLWSNTLPPDGDMSGFIDSGLMQTRSQDLPTYYRLNGAIYLCKTERLLRERSFLFRSNIYAYIMERAHSVDIDEKIDFLLADLLLNERANFETSKSKLAL